MLRAVAGSLLVGVAVTAVVAAPAGPPEDRLTIYGHALERETRGTPAEAAAAWRHALESDPGDLFAWDHLVQILARDGELPPEIERLRAQVAAWPEADVPRLRLALALQAAGVPRESIPYLEGVLLDRPSSNLAWTFLLDAFGTRQEFDNYLADVSARAVAADAPRALALLRVRLLLQMGRTDEARRLAPAAAAQDAAGEQLLDQAGLLPPENAASPPAPPPPAPLPPDFGPADPRSAPRNVQLGETALREGRPASAEEQLRRALAAAPLQTEPRMTLARLLESEGKDAEARAVLVGPLPVAPRDLYLQAWRAVRDHYHDAEFGGADVFALRRAAERRLRTPEDAHAEIDRLLATLHDTWGRRFPPAEFAHYLLAPNAGRARRPAPPPAVSPPLPDPDVPLEPPRPAPVTAAPPAPVDPRPRAVPPEAGDGMPLAYIAIPSLANFDVPARIEGMLHGAATAQGLILDLRGNGGGDGPVAVQVAGLFLGPGREVCTFWSRRGPSVQLTSRPAARLPPGPPVVLVDRQTASAAEILAAVLREQVGAVLVGERTAGKGVGQKAILLADGSGLSFTRFRITSPSGKSWDGSGLTPDLEVGSAGGERMGTDAALEAARGLLFARLSGATPASPSF